jgi:hypothetical protein
VDDRLNDSWTLRVKGGFFGEFIFSNDTGVTKKSDYQIMSFDPVTSNITFDFAAF